LHNQLKISVIIPNYNHGRFLKRRINSVLQQTFQDFEIILLDDASTDNSREIIEQYRHHPKVKTIVYNEQNSGSPFLQWRKGMEGAIGEWIWIAESDDYCEPDFLETLLSGAIHHGCILAFHEAVWVDELDREIKSPYQYPPFIMTGREFIRRYMLSENRLVNASQILFKRTALATITPHWAQYSQAGDYRLFCELLAHGEVYASGVPKAYFLRHQGAHSLNGRLNAQAIAERNETWHWLLQSGMVGAADLTRVLTAQLAGLETTRKGIPANVYWKERMELEKLATTMGLKINRLQVMLESYSRKAQHWWQHKQVSV
jgi:glycosyltransferase involved in cell wall biosynthesis